ncbi:MAG: hypothetical protein K1V80_06225 [Muribaculaceae bacterium]
MSKPPILQDFYRSAMIGAMLFSTCGYNRNINKKLVNLLDLLRLSSEIHNNLLILYMETIITLSSESEYNEILQQTVAVIEAARFQVARSRYKGCGAANAEKSRF